MRLEGVYTPTTHEGAPRRGDGPESLLGGGVTPGRWQGAPLQGGAVAGLQGTQPPQRCGCPLALGAAGNVSGSPPPPPGKGSDRSPPWYTFEHKGCSGENIPNGNSFGPEHFLREHHQNKQQGPNNQGPNNLVYRHNVRTLQMMFSVLFLRAERVRGLSVS